MFIGWELKAETESPKFIFIISLASSAFAVVGFGDVLKTSQRHCLDRKSVSSKRCSASGHGEPLYTGHESSEHSYLIMCNAMGVSDW